MVIANSRGSGAPHRGAGFLGAVRKTAAVALRDGAGQALSLPIRLLFKTVGLTRRLIKLLTSIGKRQDGLQAKIDAVPLG